MVEAEGSNSGEVEKVQEEQEEQEGTTRKYGPPLKNHASYACRNVIRAMDNQTDAADARKSEENKGEITKIAEIAFYAIPAFSDDSELSGTPKWIQTTTATTFSNGKVIGMDRRRIEARRMHTSPPPGTLWVPPGVFGNFCLDLGSLGPDGLRKDGNEVWGNIDKSHYFYFIFISFIFPLGIG
jgi:hypothetical protein